jgi:hypothetical protein
MYDLHTSQFLRMYVKEDKKVFIRKIKKFADLVFLFASNVTHCLKTNLEN